ALDVQTKLRHLRDDILPVDFAHVDHRHAVVQLQAAQRTAEGFQIFTRQSGPLDPRDHRLVGKGIEERKGAEIGENAAPLKKKRVRLNSVEQRGSQPLRRFHPDGPQILCKNRGCRAITGSKIGKTGLERRPLRVMIYHQIHSSESLLEIGRLDIDQSQLRAVFVQIFIGDPIDLNIQEADHCKIFRASHLTKGYNRRRNTIASQKFAQGQRAADGIRIRVVLQKNVNFLLAKKRPDSFDFFSVQRVEQTGRAELFENIRQLQLSEERILGLLHAIFVRS